MVFCSQRRETCQWLTGGQPKVQGASKTSPKAKMLQLAGSEGTAEGTRCWGERQSSIDAILGATKSRPTRYYLRGFNLLPHGVEPMHLAEALAIRLLCKISTVSDHLKSIASNTNQRL